MTEHWCGLYTGKDDDATIREVAAKSPGTVGVVRRVRLHELFDSEGDIDIRFIVECAVVAHDVGLELSVMIEDKTFDGTNPMPPHLSNLVKRTSNGKGYVAIRWNDTVLQETIRAFSALQLIETVHSVCVQETAPGMSDHDLDATHYTPELYSETYIELFKELARVAPGKPVNWYTNYFARDHMGDGIDEVLEATLHLGTVGLGGPDWWPTSAPLHERSYPRFLPWKQKGVKTFIGMSKPSYEQPDGDGGFYTPQQLLDGAQDTLGVSNVVWMYVKSPPQEGAYDYFDACKLWTP